jgi:hypothetical protein
VRNGVVVDIGSMKAFVLGVLAVEGIGKGVGQESIGDVAEIRQLDTVFRHSIMSQCKVAGGSADHGDLGV